MDKFVSYDDHERAILQQTQRNTAQSLEELSEAFHLLRNAVWRRGKRLQDSVILKASVALLDAQRVGLGLIVFVSISVRSHSKDWADQFTKVICGLPQVQSAYHTLGHQDYLIKARVRNVQAYDDFYQRLISHIELADVSASLVIEELKDTTELPLP
ncbi:MAG: Lrp/AsnC family transcriptional regulator [Planktomarina sp.]|uniref:Lrp/AsnC family transcriptional regulator n=1 Tax=uncultured Planktomarina sp. TaxID=1538529 RepID=UPI00289134B1|nr:Lrp/AsnC family transcriptional regulator [Planktomarina sp.]MDT2070693.1 Lrp/AsnC family transcriptional regulator [Planktomarina sp.]